MAFRSDDDEVEFVDVVSDDEDDDEDEDDDDEEDDDEELVLTTKLSMSSKVCSDVSTGLSGSLASTSSSG